MKDGGDGCSAHQADRHFGEERKAGWLAHKRVHPGVKGTLLRLGRLMGTQDDDHRRRGVTADEGRQIQSVVGAVAPAQLHIDDGHTVLIGRQVLERLFGARGTVDGVTLLSKVLTEAENDASFVVNYENSFHAIPANRKEHAGVA